LCFLALLRNDWSTLGYITSYNELHNGFFRTLGLTYRSDVRAPF